jgi:hypothetical protein
MKVTTTSTVTIVLTGDEAASLCVYLNKTRDLVKEGVEPKVARDLLYTLREIPDDGEEVFPA